MDFINLSVSQPLNKNVKAKNFDTQTLTEDPKYVETHTHTHRQVFFFVPTFSLSE